MREFKKEFSEKEKENEIKKILDKYVVTISMYDYQEMKIIWMEQLMTAIMN